MALDNTLDLVIDHDLAKFAGWVEECHDEESPWRITAVDAGDQPERAFEEIRSALRMDPDAIAVRLTCPPDEALVDLISRVGQTGHAMFLQGLPAEAIAPLRAKLVELQVQCEPAAEFLARVRQGSVRAQLSYINLGRAPRPDDLADGFDRYESYVEKLPREAAWPAQAGDELPLRVVHPALEAWQPEGTVDVVPTAAGGTELMAIATGLLPPDAFIAINGSRVRVHAVRRHDIEDWDGNNLDPEHVGYQFLLDAPAWLAPLVPHDRTSYARLSAEGRRPVMVFRAKG